jgi:prepilin-type N-terminal cleavage/methylation domain-containing protein
MGQISRPSHDSGGQLGFTLVELMVVVALLSLFSLLTIPLFGSTGTSSKLDYSARRLNGTIKYLFNEAALSGNEHRLIFNLDHGTYRASIVEDDGTVVDLAGIGQESKLAGTVRFKDLQFPGRNIFKSGEVTVRIHPTGWLDEVSVHLADESGHELTLHVLPLTGTAEFFDGYKAL